MFTAYTILVAMSIPPGTGNSPGAMARRYLKTAWVTTIEAHVLHMEHVLGDDVLGAGKSRHHLYYIVVGTPFLLVYDTAGRYVRTDLTYLPERAKQTTIRGEWVLNSLIVWRKLPLSARIFSYRMLFHDGYMFRFLLQ